jgi:hypothetical protein
MIPAIETDSQRSEKKLTDKNIFWLILRLSSAHITANAANVPIKNARILSIRGGMMYKTVITTLYTAPALTALLLPGM